MPARALESAGEVGEDPGVQGNPRRPGRLRGDAGNLGLALASLALSLLAAEGAVRLLSPLGPALLVTDPGVGKHYVPGYRGRVFVDEAGHEVEVRINSAGFRGAEWPRRKPPGGLRVAVVGDSMTAGVATDEERTFVRRLESSLAARWRGRPVEVMNFGVSSASTGAELVTWREAVAGYAPDLVLLAFFTGNDLGDNCSRLTRAPRVYFELDGDGRLVLEKVPPPTPALLRWLDLHSRLYVWQKLATRQLRAATRSAAGGIEAGQRIFARDGGPDVAYAWRLTGALLRRLRDEVEASGARFGLVVVPCAEQVDDALWVDLRRRAVEAGLELDRDEPSRRLAEIGGREGIPMVDLTPAFAEAARPPGGGSATAAGLYLLGRFHLSEEGHRVAAEGIERFLTEGAGRERLESR
jgi:lysophospholipase L1-like esterase